MCVGAALDPRWNRVGSVPDPRWRCVGAASGSRKGCTLGSVGREDGSCLDSRAACGRVGVVRAACGVRPEGRCRLRGRSSRIEPSFPWSDATEGLSRPTGGILRSVGRALPGGPAWPLPIPVQQRGRSRLDASGPRAARIRARAGTRGQAAFGPPVPCFPPHARIRRENGHETALWHENGSKSGCARLADLHDLGFSQYPPLRMTNSVPERGFVSISGAKSCTRLKRPARKPLTRRARIRVFA